ncbi:hypothetical protein ACRE_054030 [Hapsidospora chrysogenum ATCC 11550]|uniref:SnoaL-like domain-containing protein n=1 Tax=Hapsidospora chrysogenum (strain ATCC 11550 / CBS 779.69 / DSM 880 / IAM 14645 / JCM 23072 / IMI 49137) TaxID=857340 RepID=A0A086T382_HAPC1|nr:hypothetical protein ACRE_054030 [Hapsidospora chrysogenum ATCC 11550]
MAHVSPEIALAITRQKARYGRYADTKQWDKFERDIALSDARYSYCDVNGKPLQVGKQALVFDSARSAAAFFERFFAPQATMHNLGVGDFEHTAEDEVQSVFGFEDQIVSKALGSLAEIRGGGYYYETWKRVGGEWYIKDLKMVRTYQKASLLVHVLLTIAGWLGVSV